MHNPAIKTNLGRQGITLMEVLIAIGILSIGLTSVVAILPAGHKQASKALIFDRGSLIAANALADAVTIGICRETSLSENGHIRVIDPIGDWPSNIELPTPLPTSVTLRKRGVFATDSGAVVDTNKAAALKRLLAQGRDDLEFGAATSDDDPPLHLLLDGTRGFKGRFTCAIMLAGCVTATSPVAGDLARLSVVVFHNRETNASDGFLVGQISNGQLTVPPGSIPSGRKIGDLIRPGTVFFYPLDTGFEYLRQIRSAAVNSTNTAFITHSGIDLGAGPVAIAILLDSVGLAERHVTIEGSGDYAR